LEFLDPLHSRHATEEFEDRSVPPDVWGHILEVVLTDPIVAFTHRWSFLVLDQSDACRKFWAAKDPNRAWWRNGMMSVYRATLVILAMVNPLSVGSADLSNGETLEHNALHHQVQSARWEFDLGAFSLL
jgi:hypothetical protein